MAFAGFAALSLFMSYRDWRTSAQAAPAVSAPGIAPRWWQRTLWLFLPAVASALVLAGLAADSLARARRWRRAADARDRSAEEQLSVSGP